MKNVSAILIFFICAATGECEDMSQLTNSVEISATNIQHAFDLRTAEIDLLTKEAPRQKLDAVQQLLEEAGEIVRKGEFTRLCSKQSNSKFDNLLTEAFVERLLRSGDIKNLESLLKVNCPESISTTPLEYFLAESKQQDAILLLPHSYSAASTNSANKVVIRCLARAFPSLRKSELSDESFVAACEKWWITNRPLCKVNRDYKYLPGRSPQDSQRNLGLFVIERK